MPRHLITTSSLLHDIEEERDAEAAARWAVMSAKFMRSTAQVADDESAAQERSTSA